MTGSVRPVDQAMACDRLEKRAIRNLWLERVKSIAEEYPNSEFPWYLTLSGGAGRDIQILIDEGLIDVTEVGSISEKDQDKIVAVESSSSAVLQLQQRFAGLKIREVAFQDLIGGNEQFSWPRSDDEPLCRAHIVNLDLNNPLKGIPENGDVIFPVISWIRKLCQLHAKPPRNDWTLCLTLHGEVVWPEEVKVWTKKFLEENLTRVPEFAQDCKEFFGRQLFGLVKDSDVLNFTTLDRTLQQKVIMVTVPKFITRLVHNDGWNVSTERNLRYGQDERHAPMVTWIFRFTWTEIGTATPDTLYKSALRGILSGAGEVTCCGQIELQTDR